MNTSTAVNHAPDFIKVTFVWRIVFPDWSNNIQRCADCIGGVQNLLDKTVLRFRPECPVS